MKKKKINLLFVLIQINMGGAERIVLDLARKLDRSNYRIYLAFFINGVLEKNFKDICHSVFHIPKKEGLDPFAMLRISKIIQENQIDVIIAHHYMPFFYSYPGSKILHRRRLIYTEHSVAEVKMILASKHKNLLGHMTRNTDSVVGVSREIAETFKDAFPKSSERIQSIINGVDVDRFDISTDRDKLRAKWNISPDHLAIGIIANFRKVKNHACLIRAFHSLNETYPHLRLMLVGKGFPEDIENSEDEVRQLINTFGLQEKIIMAGYQEDIPGLLKTFDIFCLPSFSEGLPVSVLEAMAARVPVIGSDVWGIREVVSTETTGLLFPSNDDNALVKGLERMINDSNLRKSFAHNAFNYVNLEHGMQQWVSTYERLFNI
jgi:L-malate glycosyltransferase